ncbi:hypothetical protein RRG08_000235 [Elysia crispata]|uniref:Uncharacterized protein n=1 Tax=Elysia crispata TaxID=231223 RepID=A0AAE1E637_9GAST|nr:hypothetical protein RRG08_000235 [Elysia crispata]
MVAPSLARGEFLNLCQRGKGFLPFGGGGRKPSPPSKESIARGFLCLALQDCCNRGWKEERSSFKADPPGQGEAPLESFDNNPSFHSGLLFQRGFAPDLEDGLRPPRPSGGGGFAKGASPSAPPRPGGPSQWLPPWLSNPWLVSFGHRRLRSPRVAGIRLGTLVDNPPRRGLRWWGPSRYAQRIDGCPSFHFKGSGASPSTWRIAQSIPSRGLRPLKASGVHLKDAGRTRQG